MIGIIDVDKRQRVLGLDIGSGSIGYWFGDIWENGGTTFMSEIACNSIIFPAATTAKKGQNSPMTAKDRRLGRMGRRSHDRRKRRLRNTRKIFVQHGLAEKEFIDSPSDYLSLCNPREEDAYTIRERAVIDNKRLDRNTFVFACYPILTDRGYNNMFESINDDDRSQDENLQILSAIESNKKKWKEKGYSLPSMVLTRRREETKDTAVPVRNRSGNYQNSLDREMHKEEFRIFVESQKNNTEIFTTPEDADIFMEDILENKKGPFYQRPIKSFEKMVEYCSFYNPYHSKGRQKRMPKAHIVHIELTLYQVMDNLEAFIVKSGELVEMSNKAKRKVVDFWINDPNANEITFANIFNNAGVYLELSSDGLFSEISLKKGRIELRPSQDGKKVILDITAHRKYIEVLSAYEIDFLGEDKILYDEVLKILHYYKLESQRREQIKRYIKKYEMDQSKVDTFAADIARLDKMEGFSNFSVRFGREILGQIKEGKKHHEALESLGYFIRYVGMTPYNYLPPLEPSLSDLRWLKKKIEHFDSRELFYYPNISPQVRRIISELRRLVNRLIADHDGKIPDRILIETSRDLNSKDEQEKITKAIKKNTDERKVAENTLKQNNCKVNGKNIDKARMHEKQGGICMYCGEPLGDMENSISDGEIDHFIPRSAILIDGHKNRLLVHKKCNRDKGSQNPITYLKRQGKWESFVARVNDKFRKDSARIDWLSNTEKINDIMESGCEERHIVDTHTAIKVAMKYLNHYLYPPKNMHNKDGENHIIAVKSSLVHTVKGLWGIHSVLAEENGNKKDRNNHYHHTADAMIVATFGSAMVKKLSDYYKIKESKQKIKFLEPQLEDIGRKSPVSLRKHIENTIKKYETDKTYVTRKTKHKNNQKAFKDGTPKLAIIEKAKHKRPDYEIRNIEVVDITPAMMFYDDFGNVKKEKDLKKDLEKLKNNIESKSQSSQAIKNAFDLYEKDMIDLFRRRAEVYDKKKMREIEDTLDEKYRIVYNKKLKKKDIDEIMEKEQNSDIQIAYKAYKEVMEQRHNIEKEIIDFWMRVETVNGIKAVKKIRILSKSKTKTHALIRYNRKKNKAVRLDVKTLQTLQEGKEPYHARLNKTTSHISIYENPNKKGDQIVGLNYYVDKFIENAMPKFKDSVQKNIEKGKMELNSENLLFLIREGDIVMIEDREGKEQLYYSTGGGLVAGGHNKIKLYKINEVAQNDRLKVISLGANSSRVVSVGYIDIYGKYVEKQQLNSGRIKK